MVSCLLFLLNDILVGAWFGSLSAGGVLCGFLRLLYGATGAMNSGLLCTNWCL
jgi:hypothetical protein